MYLLTNPGALGEGEPKASGLLARQFRALAGAEPAGGGGWPPCSCSWGCEEQVMRCVRRWGFTREKKEENTEKKCGAREGHLFAVVAVAAGARWLGNGETDRFPVCPKPFTLFQWNHV